MIKGIKNIMRKFSDWANEIDISSVENVYRYRPTITLTNGEVLEEAETKHFHFKYTCSFSEYFLIINDKGVSVDGKFYPIHNIKSVEDEIIETMIVCRDGNWFGFDGLLIEEVLDNQKKYDYIIKEYNRRKRL